MASRVEELSRAAKKLSPEDRERLARELTRTLTQKVSQAFNWTRDPFTVAEDLCGAVLKSNILSEEEYRITDVRAWREMDAKRAGIYDIVHREAGTIHAFPLRRYKPRAENEEKAQPYHILSIITNSPAYPIGLITLNGIVLGKERISATDIWERLNIPESDIMNIPFSERVKIELPDLRTQNLRSTYELKEFSNLKVKGYKITLHSL
ncbi:MAG: hypothetical protein Q8R18_03355 [bacterium]|nr:hypothetical protein [bacterium]